MQEEFTIESRKELFRVGKIGPMELLSLTNFLDFDNFDKLQTIVTWCVEHVEVKQGETWVPVKTKGREVYFPLGLENDQVALNELFSYMMTNVIMKVFQKSSESEN